LLVHLLSFKKADSGQRTAAVSLTSLWRLGRKVSYYFWRTGFVNKRQ